MEFSFLVKGMIIGISIAAPVGPIGLLCVRRTLTRGRTAGIISGLGAATADAVYGCIAGFGLTYISSILVSQQNNLRLIGGAFLCYLGIRTFLSKPAGQEAMVKGSSLFGDYFSTFFLTLTNPMTILSFTAIFAGLGLVGTGGSYTSASALVLGVFIGSSSWWLILSGSVSLFRNKFTSTGMKIVNRISGIVITGFGLFALISLVR